VFSSERRWPPKETANNCRAARAVRYLMSALLAARPHSVVVAVRLAARSSGWSSNNAPARSPPADDRVQNSS
jgi:hypothetical protein